jgi:hypothetical protein
MNVNVKQRQVLILLDELMKALVEARMLKLTLSEVIWVKLRLLSYVVLVPYYERATYLSVGLSLGNRLVLRLITHTTNTELEPVHA